MKDEIAYVKGERESPTALDNPRTKTIFKGIVSLGACVVLLVMDVIIWDVSGKGVPRLVAAVPVAFILGVYWLIRGVRMPDQ